MTSFSQIVRLHLKRDPQILGQSAAVPIFTCTNLEALLLASSRLADLISHRYSIDGWITCIS